MVVGKGFSQSANKNRYGLRFGSAAILYDCNAYLQSGQSYRQGYKKYLESKFQNFELLVINDGGTDNTEEVVRSFCDSRITYYWKQNEQKGIAKNFGFDKAKGRYVCSFDDDDIMYSHQLETVRNLIREHDDPPVAYVHFNIINEQEEVIGFPPPLQGNINELLTRECPLSNNGMYLRTDITDSMRYLHNAELKLSADWLLWLRISVRYPIVYSNEATHGVLAHVQRGSASTKAHIYIKNKQLFLEALRADSLFMEKRKHELKFIIAYYDTYIALYLSLQGDKLKTVKYFISGVLKNPYELFRRRTLAICKYLLIRW